MPQGPIRAVDVGGNGARIADIYGDKVANLKTIAYIKSVDELLNFVCSNLPNVCRGISYAVAGEICGNEKVVKSPNLSMLDGKSLARLTSEKSKKPTFVGNDMDGAVAGMAILLPALGRKYFMGLTWSSGLGLRIYKNSEILATWEGGHVPLDSSLSAPLCPCGLRGCAESLLGGESIKKRIIFELHKYGMGGLLSNEHPCALLDQHYDNGYPWAVEIYRSIADSMGRFLAIYQTIFRLPLVVWKGTFAIHALPRIKHLIREAIRCNSFNSDWEKEMKFQMSPSPDADALIGAAALFEKHFKK